MTFFGFILKNLTRRTFRTALTLAALATAIGSVMALLGVAKGFTASFRGVYESHRVDVVVTREGSADRLSSSLEERYADRVAEVEGIRRVAPVLLETLSLEDQQVYGIPSMGMPADSWLLNDYAIDRGAFVADKASPPVYLGKNLADRVKMKPGDAVDLFEEKFTVAGIFTSGSVWENGSMILALPDLQRLSGREGQITYINVVLHESATTTQLDDTILRIGKLDPKLLALATDEFVESDTRMRLASAMAWMTSAIALVVGAIGTLNTMMTSVLERTGEIGILRAIGWPTRRIVGVIVSESLLLSIVASVLGGFAAAGLLELLARGDTTGGLLQPSLDAATWVRGGIIGLSIGLLGAILPALRASRMKPTDALRQTT